MAIEWQKVKHTRTWQPTFPGEEIVGFYLGQSQRVGPYGLYKVATFAVMDAEGRHIPLLATGASLIAQIDEGGVQQNEFVRVVFGGTKDLGSGRAVKLFNVYTAVGWISPEDLQACRQAWIGTSQEGT